MLREGFEITGIKTKLVCFIGEDPSPHKLGMIRAGLRQYGMTLKRSTNIKNSKVQVWELDYPERRKKLKQIMGLYSMKVYQPRKDRQEWSR